MLSSTDLSSKFEEVSKEIYSLYSPNSKKVFLRKSSKTIQKRMKPKRPELKIETEIPLQKKNSSKKNRSTKLSRMIVSSKAASGKIHINSPSSKVIKSSSKLLNNNSNRSLKFSLSPKSSHLSLEEIEYPLKPSKAIILLKSELTPYEQGEILKYSEVFYVGYIKNKISPRIECENYGFDDTHTDYLCIKKDHIAYRYEILNLLGKGSFGQVCECFDHKKREKVALKIIKNKPKFHQQARVEVRILQAIRENDPDDTRNIIRMKNYFSFRNHVCITFELISVNLFEFLRLNHFEGISLSLIKCFAKQVINALEYTSSLNIVHCDLKPENILLVNSQKALIKLIDFGSSCFIKERLHTYIQSRFYRAPEIILGIPYTCAIDMWSLGCILIELYTGHPIWPGESEFDQLLHIISYLGMPPAEVLQISPRKSLFFDGNLLKTTKLISGKIITPACNSIQSLLKETDHNFFDFVSKCFDWNPSKRLKPLEASLHPWLKSQKSPNKLNKK
jgi:dual specificity tyrosine-phosphorylation-regulated kinase 2/3/4